MKGNRTTDVSIIFKAAKILGNGYLHLQQEFTGSFPTTSESNSIPPILKSFLHVLLYGSAKSKNTASIGQQIIFNFVIMVGNQPIFSQAKKLQWKFPHTEFVEDSFLVILGAMHTEARSQPATTTTCSVRVTEIGAQVSYSYSGASFPELSHFVLQ